MLHSISTLFNGFKIVSMEIISSVAQEASTCHVEVFLRLERGGKWISGNSFHTTVYLSVSLQIAHVLYLQLCSTFISIWKKKNLHKTIVCFMLYSLTWLENGLFFLGGVYKSQQYSHWKAKHAELFPRGSIHPFWQMTLQNG